MTVAMADLESYGKKRRKKLMKHAENPATKPFHEGVALSIDSRRRALLEHRLYRELETVEDLAVFMEHHVYAVWDFMSLLKALQARLTCACVPWLPQGDGRVRRLVNEIVLGEESDILPSGGAASHFELYLQAMQEAGADTTVVSDFILRLRSGEPVMSALEGANAPAAVMPFVRNTFEVIESGHPHEIAAAFTYGREDLIPEMFTRLVQELETQFPGKLATLRYYLDRHIELDGDEHGAMGREMVELLCDRNTLREREAAAAAASALQARIELWEGITRVMESSKKPALLHQA